MISALMIIHKVHNHRWTPLHDNRHDKQIITVHRGEKVASIIGTINIF